MHFRLSVCYLKVVILMLMYFLQNLKVTSNETLH